MKVADSSNKITGVAAGIHDILKNLSLPLVWSKTTCSRHKI